MSNATNDCSRSVQIALLLLKELKLGPESAWHIWIQSLPQRFHTLLHWRQEELEDLQMNSTSAERAFILRVSLSRCQLSATFLTHTGRMATPSQGAQTFCCVPVWSHMLLRCLFPFAQRHDCNASQNLAPRMRSLSLPCLAPFSAEMCAQSLLNLTQMHIPCTCHAWADLA